MHLAHAEVSPSMQAGVAAAEEALSGAVRRLRARLVTRVGGDVPVALESVAPATIDDLARVAVEGLWCTFVGDAGELRAIAAFDGELLGELTCRMLGGADAPVNWTPRPPTEVETRVGARVCRELLEALEASWPAGTPARFRPAVAMPAARALSMFEGIGPIALATIAIGGSGACLRVAVILDAPAAPPARIEPAPRLVAPRAPQLNRVLPIELELIAELGRVALPIGRLEELCVGEEIVLGSLGEIRARVGGQATFVGEAGTRGGMRALRVTRRIEDSSGVGHDR